MTGWSARQVRVSLCDVVSGVRRASMSGYLHKSYNVLRRKLVRFSCTELQLALPQKHSNVCGTAVDCGDSRLWGEDSVIE